MCDLIQSVLKSGIAIKLLKVLFALLLCTLFACVTPNPDPGFGVKRVKPVRKVTSFTKALSDLGKLTEIYGTELLKIQSRAINDNTGTSEATDYEIPKSLSLVVTSCLNAIGGKVIFIPYWPDYVYRMQSVGNYPKIDQKLQPNVILTGGITEFDRGLELTENKTDFAMETSKVTNHPPKPFSGNKLGLEWGRGRKRSMSSITLDFNLLSYEALCGIPKMQTTNSINVYKAIAEKEFGFSLLGPTIGLKGSLKQVQGRHNACRLLVQFSIIELVSKYLDIPYWRLIPGSKPDPVITDAVSRNFQGKDRFSQVLMLQEMLILNGHDSPVSGILDGKTKIALHEFNSNYNGIDEEIPTKLYLELYFSVPISRESLERRNLFNRLFSNFQTSMKRKAKSGQRNSMAIQNMGRINSSEALKEYKPLDVNETIDRILKKLGNKGKIEEILRDQAESRQEVEGSNNAQGNW